MTRAGARDQLSAGGLALLVHLLLFLGLMFGVSWKTLPETPVYADLWRSLPAPPLPLPPEPAPKPVIPPPKPVAAPKPVAPPKAEPPEKRIDPDIALKEKKKKEEKKAKEALAAKEAERKRLEQIKADKLRQEQLKAEKARQDELKKQSQEAEKKRHLEEEKQRQDVERRRKLEEEMQRAERDRLAQEEKLLQKRRDAERKAAEAKRLAQEKARKDMEALLAADMAGDLEAEAKSLRQQAAATARLKVVDEFKVKIQFKIKGLLVNPPGMRGKPEAHYRVDLLPNGEVIRATLVKSSGQPAYDRAVESAIIKATPLPLPPDRDAAAAFRDGLDLRFRPD